ncbi:CotH kinase family protein [Lactobacillus johnsonii]|uniref:CotH kinase family protein n=1 Tax=Lactobacillus johnsonii TaxID=33959 RepID=UPI001780DC10|nr:CotH kinase family protein [Lactobacillus johnsonii]QXL48450.1 CotH kinase family protein [Lactobacillus johnsonii]
MDTINLVNNGKPYFFRLDIAKESGQIARFTDWIKTRVSDNGKKVPIQWYDQGTVMNVHGFYPFIEGGVGKWIKDDDTGELVPSTDVVYRTWQGTPADTSDNGIAYYTLEDQFFTKQGEFVGTFGLRDDNGNNLTSVNLVFSVLGNDLRLTQAKDYYIKDLENLKRKFENDGNQAVADFNAKIEAGTETDRQTLDALRASIQANRDGQASIAEQQAAITRQINDQDIITKTEYNNNIKDISDQINQRLANAKLTPIPIDNFDKLSTTYPSGTDGVYLTKDNRHLWTWLNSAWQDLGTYQAFELDENTKKQISDSFNHVRKENLIPNGSFSNGTEGVLANTGNFKLFVSQYLNRNWLNLSSQTTDKYQGIHWNVKSQVEHFSYPIHLSWDWQTSQPSTFYVNILYLDASGKQVGFQQIGKYWLNNWRFTNFDQYIQLDKTQSKCYNWQVQIYRDGADAFPTTMITDVSATLSYDSDQAYANNNQIKVNKNNLSDVSNHVLKENLIPNSSFLDISAVNTKTADTTIFTSRYLNRNWLNVTSSTTSSSPDKGVFWDVPFPSETYYPFKISFDVHSDADCTLNIAVAYIGSSDNILKWQNIGKCNISANKFTHWQSLLKLSGGTNAQTLRVFIFKAGNNALPTLMLTDVVLHAEYLDAEDTLAKNAGRKNLIFNGDFQKGAYNVLPIDPNSFLTVSKYLDKSWLNFKSDGVLWNFDLTSQNGEAFSYNYELNFTIQFAQDTDLTIRQQFFDASGKYLATYTIDKKRFTQYRFTDYHTTFKLGKVDGAASWQLQLAPSAGGQITDVSLTQLFDTSNSYSLPVVYLDGDTTGMDKSTFKKMYFSLWKNNVKTQGYAEVKWQGDSSLTFAKKGLRLKLYTTDNYDQKLKIQPKASWKATNKFNLKAYPNDALLCHDVVNANIGADIWNDNLSLPDELMNENNLGFIDGFPIVLFINNLFQGVYSFNLPRSDFDTAKYAVIGDQYTETTAFKKVGAKLDGSDFESLNPETSTESEKNAVNNLIDFIANSSDDDFKANLTSHVDLNSAIDYLIFSNIIGDGDAWGKNQVLLSYNGTIWHWHPYDLDGSYGLNWTGGFTVQSGKIWGQDHMLFSRLMQLFLPQIKERYKQLRTWLTPTYVANKYRDYIDNVGSENYALDWKAWNPKSQNKNSLINLRKNIQNQFRVCDKAWLGE